MELGFLQNGTRKTRKRKRNGPVKAKAKNPATSARRTTSLTQAKAAAKRNGFKLAKIGSAQQNGKRKRGRKRNGITATPRARNGFFGNTKSDLKNVAALGGGLFGTKALSKALTPILMPYMSQVGAGQYTEAAVEAAIAFFLAPWAGNKIGGKGAGDMARLGGIFTAVLSAVDAFSPGLLNNPFSSPIVMASNGPAIKTSTVQQLVSDVANSPNPQAAASQIAGALNAIDNGVGFAGARGSAIPLGTF